MKDYTDDDFPRRSKIVQKGRKQQKIREVVKNIDIHHIPESDELEYMFDEIDSYKRVSTARR